MTVADIRPTHGVTILALLKKGTLVSIEAMAREIYADRPRPESWAASLRSTINGLRRSQSREGAALVWEQHGYRLLTGASAPILLPGRFKRFRGFLPAAAMRRAA